MVMSSSKSGKPAGGRTAQGTVRPSRANVRQSRLPRMRALARPCLPCSPATWSARSRPVFLFAFLFIFIAPLLEPLEPTVVDEPLLPAVEPPAPTVEDEPILPLPAAEPPVPTVVLDEPLPAVE